MVCVTISELSTLPSLVLTRAWIYMRLIEAYQLLSTLPSLVLTVLDLVKTTNQNKHFQPFLVWF